MSEPSISVVTINLNNADGLARTISSVVSQTLSDLEYIIVDGGSTDGSVDVIRRNAGRITSWSSERDSGLYDAMNRGLSRARGRYVMILNSADVLASESVLQQMLAKGGGADVIYGNIGLAGSDGISEIQSAGVVEYWKQYQHNLPPQPAMLIARRLYAMHGGFDVRYRLIADVVLISRIFARQDVIYRKISMLVTVFDTSGISSDHRQQGRIFSERAAFLSEEFPHYLPALREAMRPPLVRRLRDRLARIHAILHRILVAAFFTSMLRKIAKLLSRKGWFHVNEYLFYRTKRYLERYQQQAAARDDMHWNALFTPGAEHFVSDLPGGRAQMRLYRDSLLSRFIHRGDFEQIELSFLSAFLRPGDHFIDVGANLGLFSLVASPIVGETGRVIAFEPAPVTFQRLQDNLELNGFRNVEARNLGLSDKAGFLSLQISEIGHDAWNSFAEKASDRYQKKVDVPVSTLDEELATVDRSRITLLKVDVEGWEKFVLRGGEKFLRECEPALLVELTEANCAAAGYRTQEIFDLLVGWGYRWYRYRGGRLFAEEGREVYQDDNLIALRDPARYRDRVGL
jgi:FkbM family methyltransferase